MTAAVNGRQRLDFFVALGMLRAIPSRWQLWAGTMAMLPFMLNETPLEYTTNRRTFLGQLPHRIPLQVLYCPQQVVTGTGLWARPEVVVRHLLSSFHDDAVIAYDLQLLQTHPGGLATLAVAAAEVAAGTRRGAWLLTQLCGGPGYHAHLRELAVAAQTFRYPVACADPRFSTLVGFAEFCLTLPDFSA